MNLANSATSCCNTSASGSSYTDLTLSNKPAPLTNRITRCYAYMFEVFDATKHMEDGCPWLRWVTSYDYLPPPVAYDWSTPPNPFPPACDDVVPAVPASGWLVPPPVCRVTEVVACPVVVVCVPGSPESTEVPLARPLGRVMGFADVLASPCPSPCPN